MSGREVWSSVWIDVFRMSGRSKECLDRLIPHVCDGSGVVCSNHGEETIYEINVQITNNIEVATNTLNMRNYVHSRQLLWRPRTSTTL